MDTEEREWMNVRLRESLDERDVLDRIEEMVKRRKAVNGREIAAYETLLKLHPDPDVDVVPLRELENLVENIFGTLVGDVVEDGVAEGSSCQPQDAQQGDTVESARVSEEEVAQYRNCASLIEIADRFADLNDEEVYVAKITDIAEAMGWTNRATKRPRKQLWLRSYSSLKKSDRFEYGGQGTGRFTRKSRPGQSEQPWGAHAGR